jgi:hypothetical protein
MPALSAADLGIDFSADPDADRRALRLHAECGCFVARGLLHDEDLEPARAAIRRLISLRLKALGLDEEPPNGHPPAFDAGFRRLIEHDPRNRWLIHQAAMFALPVHQIGADARLAQLSRLLMRSDAVMASELNSLQIHLPGEEKHLLPWHQDYPWVQDSEDAVVYWIPLRDLGPESGALRLAVGSHRRGVLTLRGQGPAGPLGRALTLAEPTAPDQFPQLVVHVRPGEVLVFSTLLLHASVPNRSAWPRWTVQVRHGNFGHPRALARDWPGTRPGSVPFAQSHPEYYVDAPDPAEDGSHA